MERLQHYSPQALELLASRLAGRSVELLFLPQAKPGLTVLLGAGCLVLEPERSGLYDLVLGAHLLRFCSEARQWKDSRQVPNGVVRRWVAEARARIARRFPNALRRCGGLFHPAIPGAELPLCTWRRVPWKPETYRPAAGEQLKPVVPSRGMWVPGLEVDASPQEIYEALVEAIQSGQLVPQHFPELRNLPVYTLPGRVSAMARWDRERLERTVRQREKYIRMFIDCFTRTATNQAQVEANWLRYTQGSTLDGARLAEAALCLRTGTPARVFRRKQHWHTDALFRPEQHFMLRVTAMAFQDEEGEAHVPEEAIYAEVFRRLGVRYAVVALADQVLVLPDGKPIYLHMPVILKHPDEPFSDRVYRRLWNAASITPTLPQAQLGCVPTMALRAAQQMFTRMDPAHVWNRHGLVLALSRPLPNQAPFGYFHAPWFLSQVAATCEELLEQMEQSYQQLRHESGQDFRLDPIYLFLPREVTGHAKPGTRVSRALL